MRLKLVVREFLMVNSIRSGFRDAIKGMHYEMVNAIIRCFILYNFWGL